MGTWLTNNKDIIGIALAVIGLAVTAYTVATARTSQRRDAFMRMHEVLLLPEIQEGRRLLYQVDAIDDVPSQDTIEYQKDQPSPCDLRHARALRPAWSCRSP